MCDVVRGDIKNLVEKELKAANEKFPLFQSNHEGYAIIKEELEESKEELEVLEDHLNRLWVNTRLNSKNTTYAYRLKKHAISLAVESIQVAAMAQKYIDSQKVRDDAEKWINEIMPFRDEVEE
jgi:hypothetical protein